MFYEEIQVFGLKTKTLLWYSWKISTVKPTYIYTHSIINKHTTLKIEKYNEQHTQAQSEIFDS